MRPYHLPPVLPLTGTPRTHRTAGARCKWVYVNVLGGLTAPAMDPMGWGTMTATGEHVIIMEGHGVSTYQ